MRKSISQLNMLSPEEYSQIISSFNDTAVDYPKDKCVHTLFEEQVEKTPDKVAVIACDRTLTYKELNEQANRIARSLIERGIGIGDIVAFMLPRRSYLLSVMFGILKSGAAYMPIDPDYPQDRIDYMLKDSYAKFCVAEDNISELLENSNTTNPNLKISSKSHCYCIYTSGSTGKPKGTVLKHCNVANFCSPNRENHFTNKLVNNCEAVVATNSVSFDIVLQEIHMPLLNGLSVLFFNSNGTFEDAELRIMKKFNDLGLITTPVKMNMFLQNESFCKVLKNISVIMIGADVLSDSLVGRVSELTTAKIINGYGPTETTCGISYSNNLLDCEINLKSNFSKASAQLISSIKVLSKSEYKQVISSFNDTAVDYPKEKCVHTLFEEQVEKTADTVAVIACDRELTYKELNEQANRIAHSLIEKGIGNGDIVAFMLPRRSYLLSVMFGILKSGAAYMPIDPDYPQDRIDYMLADSDAKLCITEDNIAKLLENDNNANPNIVISPDSLCYCIYTSGSTGKPKGTIIRHSNFNNFCHKNNNNNYQTETIIKGSTILATFKTCFDAFGVDSMLFLLNGKRMVFTSEEQMNNPELLADLIIKYNVDVIHSTPTIMSMNLKSEHYQKSLKYAKVILIAAESFHPDLLDKLKNNSSADIFNGYGPSETTIGVSFGEININ